MLRKLVFALVLCSLPSAAFAFGSKSPEEKLRDALIDAVNGGDSTRVAQLIQEGANPNGAVAVSRNCEFSNYSYYYYDCDDTDPMPVLEYAVRHSNQYVVQALVEGGANVNAEFRNTTALSQATTNPFEVNLLLQHGANPNYPGVASGLVSAGCTPAGLSAIYTAAGFGTDFKDAVAKVSCDNEYAFEAEEAALFAVGANKDGLTTVLFNAVAYDNVARAQFAIHEGANVASVNSEGRNVVMVAAQSGALNVLKALLAMNVVDVNARDHETNTALMLAASAGKIDAVTALLAAKADPNAKTAPGGDTALILAAKNQGSCAVVVALLEAGACINVIDLIGMTAMAYANQRNDVDFVNLLKLYLPKEAAGCPKQLNR